MIFVSREISLCIFCEALNQEAVYSNKPQGVGRLQASSSLEASAWGLRRPMQKVFQGELQCSDK